MDPGQALLSSAYPYIRSLAVLLIGIMGCFVFGMVGSMTYPGIGAILGAVVGFIVFTLVGCIVVGKWKDIIPDGVDTSAFVPGAIVGAVYSHPEFTLYVTVHKAVDISTNAGIMGLFGITNDSYVSVECGSNPVKATCVRRDNVWNETFKMTVRPKDAAITFNLLDQDIIGDDLVGTVSIFIDTDVIEKGFPQETAFKLETAGKDKKGKAKLFLSFDYGDDLGVIKTSSVQGKNPLAYQQRQERHRSAAQQWQQQYGTFSAAPGQPPVAGSLASLHFNTDPYITKDLAQKMQPQQPNEQQKQAGTGSASNLSWFGGAAQQNTAPSLQV